MELHHTGAVHAVVFQPGDELPGRREVATTVTVGFLTLDGDGILVESSEDGPGAMNAWAAQLGQKVREATGYPAEVSAGAGELHRAEASQRARRHDELDRCWDWNKPADWNHHNRASLLLDWATDPATPGRDAGIYAALHAGEVQASYLAQQAEETRELREELGGCLRELEDTTVTVYPGAPGARWRDFLRAAKGWLK